MGPRTLAINEGLYCRLWPDGTMGDTVHSAMLSKDSYYKSGGGMNSGKFSRE